MSHKLKSHKLKKVGGNNRVVVPNDVQYICKNKKITDLDLSKCPNLEYLDCGFNNIEVLDLSKCPNLKKILCRDNNIKVLDLSQCPNLEYLDCFYNQIITDLNLSQCSNLEFLDCGLNDIKVLDLSKCPNLKKILCRDNNIKVLDLSQCPQLVYLSCFNNQITDLDLSQCPNLMFLDYSNNQITDLDLSQCTNLEDYKCDHNKIKVLNLNKFTKLKSFGCSNNEITDLDLSQCPNLKILNCSNNEIELLDLSHCANLEELECLDNQIQSVQLKMFSSLRQINYQSNELTILEILNCPELRVVQCSHNLISTLNIQGCPNLTFLYCQNNKLNDLDGIKDVLIDLAEINIHDNPLSNFTLPLEFFIELNQKIKTHLKQYIKVLEKRNFFFKQDYIDIFRGFDFGELKNKFDEIIIYNEFNKHDININWFNSSICKNKISTSYFEKTISNLFTNPNFDCVCCLQKYKIIAFCIVQKGDCKNYPNYYTVNLICSESVSRILLGFYIYCCHRNNQPIGLLELGGSLSNIAGYVAYTKMGFYYDYKDTKLNCFDTKRNLQMKVNTKQIDNNFYDILSGKKKYTNKLIAENLFNDSKMDKKTFENIRTGTDMNALKQTIQNGNFNNIVEEYDNVLEKMQHLYIIDNDKKMGGRKNTKKRKMNKKKHPKSKKMYSFR
jgi:Leucine-rich repeat (LRR) protein